MLKSNYNLIAVNDVKCQVYSALLRFRPKYKGSYINKAKEQAKKWSCTGQQWR